MGAVRTSGYRVHAYVSVLLALAATLDWLTGPTVAAAAFYFFPVALAGLRLGSRWGTGDAVGAVMLNALVEHLWAMRGEGREIWIINETLWLAVVEPVMNLLM